MKWINPALGVAAIITSAYFGYVTSQLTASVNDKTVYCNKKQNINEITTVIEQMKKMRLNIKNMNILAKELEEKLILLIKNDS